MNGVVTQSDAQDKLRRRGRQGMRSTDKSKIRNPKQFQMIKKHKVPNKLGGTSVEKQVLDFELLIPKFPVISCPSPLLD